MAPERKKFFRTFSDVFSYAYIRLLCFWFPCIYGTILLQVKALLFGIAVGRNVRCFGTIHLLRAPQSTIRLGNNVTNVSNSPRCTSGSLYAPTKLQTHTPSACIIIDDDVGLNGTSVTARSRTIRIGKGSMIAPNVVIMDSDFHALWPPETRIRNPAVERDVDVTIGEHVWIASGCIILKGVTIGDNSVVAAGSVVTSDIPPDVLVGGTPARVIRRLDDDAI